MVNDEFGKYKRLVAFIIRRDSLNQKNFDERKDSDRDQMSGRWKIGKIWKRLHDSQ